MGKMTKSQAGRKGGLTTFVRHGSEHMREIGLKGALAMHGKYTLVKLSTSDFAIVDRETGIPTGKTINGNILNLDNW